MKRSKLFIFLLVLVFSLTSVTFADTLKYGSKGAGVTKLQSQLKKLGYFKSNATGYYGSITKAAVKKFQASRGISTTGTVGPQTTKALAAVGTSSRSLTSSRSGSAVSDSQASGAGTYNKENQQVQLMNAASDENEVEVNTEAVDSTLEDGTTASEGEEEIQEPEKEEPEEPAKPDSKSKIEVLDWWTSANKVFARGSNAKVIDVRTGKSFYIKRTYGGNHADCETLTKEDTKIMKEIWGGFNWSRRPVIVEINGRLLAASMAGMPHAGLDNKPTNATVSGRSEGYGRGTNLDAVKNNGMDGHFDVHFKNSRTHGTNKVDPAHQKAIKEAASAKL